ncbi:MAG: site-specific DNA-methyltransferase [Phycisphaerales bacterium]|nr:site-specific DNA-methyltransferase [Phycisphaerales bacterium]
MPTPRDTPGQLDVSAGPMRGSSPSPHPLSEVCHEFVWEGKYDEHGRRRMPDAPALPLRVVEEWRGGPGEAAGGVRATDEGAGPSPNLLLRGENKIILASLLPRFRGSIDLIYIDPPYDSGVDYRVEVPVGQTRTSVHAYRDAWGDGRESYAHMMAERLALMRELLHPDGCIFVHCDWRANAVIRLIMDDIFGRACFRNEIVWRRAPNLGRQAASSQLGRVVDSILVYSAREGTPFRGQTPTRSQAVEVDRSGKPRGAKWDEKRQLYFTTAPRGDYTDESVARLRAEGRVWESATGKLYVKYFLRKGDDGRWYKDQPVDTLWDDAEVRPLRHCSKKELEIGYATQKPEGLLRRIISWGCPPGGLVGDFFCGSGTTGVVAGQLGRRWIMADLGRQAIHTTRKRLLMRVRGGASEPVGQRHAGRCSLDLLDLSPHDRRHWFARVYQGDIHAYRRTVLGRFGFSGESRAEVCRRRDSLIHARRGDVALHVADADRVVDAEFAGALADAARFAGVERVFCFAFEYEVDIRRDLEGVAAARGVRVHPVLIPPEIMESNRRELPAWVEVACVGAEVVGDEPVGVTVRLRRYEVMFAEGHGAASRLGAEGQSGLDLIDAWAIDTEWERGQPFRPVWHAQRALRGRALALESERISLSAFSRSFLVRVFDVFGQETSVSLALPSGR